MDIIAQRSKRPLKGWDRTRSVALAISPEPLVRTIRGWRTASLIRPNPYLALAASIAGGLAKRLFELMRHLCNMWSARQSARMLISLALRPDHRERRNLRRRASASSLVTRRSGDSA